MKNAANMILGKIQKVKYFHPNKGLLSNFINLSFIQVSNAILQITLFPIIVRIIGLHEFGYVMVANSFAALMGIFINYGTNQSGIKHIALSRNNPNEKSHIFFSVIYSRMLLFCIAILILGFLYYINIPNISYYLFASALIFSEVLNPLFFFIGIEKLFFFNLVTLLSKISSLVLISVLIKQPQDAPIVNLYLGLPGIAAYALLILYAIQRNGLILISPKISIVLNLLKQNFYLVFNSLSVHLQQSFFLFQLSFIASPLILGAYSLCDKIIWASRLLISSFSSAVYPKSTLMYASDPKKWQAYKKKLNILLAVIFSMGGLFLFLFPEICIRLITGNRNQVSENFLKIIAFTPLIIALNSLNVIDILLRNAYVLIFKISIILFCISAGLSILLTYINHPALFAYYPLIIESTCLVVYTLFIRKKITYTNY